MKGVLSWTTTPAHDCLRGALEPSSGPGLHSSCSVQG